MENLRDILRKYSVPPQVLGTRTVDRDALRAELTRLQVHLRAMAWIAAAMIAIVFIVEIVIAAVYVQSPGVLAGVAGAMGVTIAGAIEAMRRLVRETAQVNLVVIFASELSSDQLVDIINMLAGKLERRALAA
jgi:hypothetical protein